MKNVEYTLIQAFILMALCHPLSLSAQAKPGAPSSIDSNSAQNSSFIDYMPTASEFQKELRPLISLFRKGVRLQKAGQKLEAEKNFRAVAEKSTSLLSTLSRGYHDELFFVSGLSYQNLNKTEEALQAFQQAVKLKSTNPIYLFHHGRALKDARRCKRAIPRLKEVLWLTPENKHETLYLIAECHFALGEEEEALKVSEEANVANPRYLPILKRLVDAKLKNLEETVDPTKRKLLESQMITDLELIVGLDPKDNQAITELAKLLLSRGDPIFSPSTLARAGQLASTLVVRSAFADPADVKLLVDTQLKMNDLPAAEKTLKKGLEKSPGSEELKAALRQIEIEKGLFEQKDPEAG